MNQELNNHRLRALSGISPYELRKSKLRKSRKKVDKSIDDLRKVL